MAAKSSKRAPKPQTVFSFVGNTGCIRFPVPVRKAAGVKRGDRLLISAQRKGKIVLQKVGTAQDGPEEAALELEACACEGGPGSCSKRKTTPLLTVGWSYVQLDEALAKRIGFSAGAPIRIAAETNSIVVERHSKRSDLEGVDPVVCPP